MKRIFPVLAATMLLIPAALRAQDAATEERLNKLSAQIQDLVIAKDAQNKRIEELAKAIRDLQDQQNQPSPNYASQEDLKQLAAKLQEIDKKRQDDYDLIQKNIQALGKSFTTTLNKVASTPPPAPAKSSGSDKAFEYTVQPGDTVSAIAKAYTDQGYKVTVDQILKANPGLKPESMSVGTKLMIPAVK